MNSIEFYFPNTLITGCFFHFTQSIWRKIQSLGSNIIQRYSTESEFSIKCRLLPALAFLPIDPVSTEFNRIYNEFLETEPELFPLLEYFDVNYIGSERRNARFRIEIWNQYNRVCENLCRTNNGVEAWHRFLSSLFENNHPSFYKFFDEIKKLIKFQDIKIEQIITGQILSPRKKNIDL